MGHNLYVGCVDQISLRGSKFFVWVNFLTWVNIFCEGLNFCVGQFSWRVGLKKSRLALSQ